MGPLQAAAVQVATVPCLVAAAMFKRLHKFKINAGDDLLCAEPLVVALKKNRER